MTQTAVTWQNAEGIVLIRLAILLSQHIVNSEYDLYVLLSGCATNGTDQNSLLVGVQLLGQQLPEGQQ